MLMELFPYAAYIGTAEYLIYEFEVHQTIFSDCLTGKNNCTYGRLPCMIA